MGRVERLTDLVYGSLAAIKTEPTIVLRYMEHLGGVALLCALLARKRGLDAEICQAAGLLHDLWLYRKGFPITPEERKLHGEYGAVLAREMTERAGGFSEGEIQIIRAMVFNHNYKEETHGEYDELLKDADAFAHLLTNSEYDKTYRYFGRGDRVLSELGLAET